MESSCSSRIGSRDPLDGAKLEGIGQFMVIIKPGNECNDCIDVIAMPECACSG